VGGSQVGRSASKGLCCILVQDFICNDVQNKKIVIVLKAEVCAVDDGL
jgi:hypothetical protein